MKWHFPSVFVGAAIWEIIALNRPIWWLLIVWAGMVAYDIARKKWSHDAE